MLEILKQLLENLVNVQKVNFATTTGFSKKDDEVQKIATVLSIYYQTPAASSKFIKPLTQFILTAEQSIMIEASSPFREVLMKFLLRFPGETVEMFLEDSYIKDPLFSRFFEFLVKHKDGKPFREYIQNHMVGRLIEMVTMSTGHVDLNTQQRGRNELYQSIRIVSILIKYDDQWLSSNQELVETYKQVWCNDEYQERHKTVESLDYAHWKEPKLLVKILLHYFCKHPNDIDLLFQLLRAMCDRFIPDFTVRKLFF